MAVAATNAVNPMPNYHRTEIVSGTVMGVGFAAVLCLPMRGDAVGASGCTEDEGQGSGRGKARKKIAKAHKKSARVPLTPSARCRNL